MTKQIHNESTSPMGFNEAGRLAFAGFVEDHANYELTDEQITAFWDAIPAFEKGEIVATIELGRGFTISGQSITYGVPRDHVIFA